MDWAEQVDAYCERVDFSFWSEPVNAISNLSFIFAALICWTLAARNDRLDHLSKVLLFQLSAIGVGSFLFHTTATRWGQLADVLPIVMFIMTFIYAASTRFLRLGSGPSLLIVIFCFLLNALFPALWKSTLPSINGSENYLPVLLIMIGYSIALLRKKHPAAIYILAATAMLSLSLTFRSVDISLCAIWPLGFHFIWHLLNGLLLGVLLSALVRHGADQLAPPRARS
jgi:hypothetical protein